MYSDNSILTMLKPRLSKEELEAVRKRIIKALQEIIPDAGAKGAVLGLSGGLDSSVVLKLASEAGVDLHVLLMPEEGVTDTNCVDDALGLVKSLKIEHSMIPINEIIESYSKTSKIDVVDRLAWGNVKARIRMTINYLYSNLEDRIVLGTGNRTELLMGYYTKYGDGGVDLLPIGSLYKCQVRQLAKQIGIPKRIIEKKPSAGLWIGQTDEEDLGIDYDLLDKALYYLTEEWCDIHETSKLTGVKKEKIADIVKTIEKNRHKLVIPQII